MKNNKKYIIIIEDVIEVVSNYYQVDITEDTKARHISTPRAVASYLIREFIPMISYEVIAKYLKRKRTNTYLMTKKIKESMPFDKKLREEITEIRNTILNESENINKTETIKEIRNINKIIHKLSIGELLVLKKRLESESFKLKDNLTNV